MTPKQDASYNSRVAAMDDPQESPLNKRGNHFVGEQNSKKEKR